MAISLTALGVNVDRLYHGQPTVAGGTVYTAPGSVGSTARTQLAKALICNPSSSDLTVRLGLVPQGTTADGTHYLLGDAKVSANDTLSLDLSTFMRPGDVLDAQSASLPAPVPLTAAGSTTGGTLAANPYFYKITGTNANGETLPGLELTVTTTGSTSSVVLTWQRLLGATGYKVYRSTASNTEVLLATVTGGATLSYTDTGTATTSGTPPTAGTASGCIFTISGAELPA